MADDDYNEVDIGTGKMMEVTYVNPYTWESEKARASGTAKRTSKGRYKRGGATIMERAIAETKKVRERSLKESQKREVKFLRGCKLSQRDASLKPSTEQSFGSLYAPGSGPLCGLSEKVTSDLSSSVVALALFDGDVKLFACTGIALPDRTVNLKRFLTSARLVDVFHNKRNTEDDLNIKVRLPNKKIISGFIELYDKDIAVITSLTLTRVRPVVLNRYTSTIPIGSKMPAVAVGRSFELCGLMATFWIDGSDTTEAALGGPVVDLDGTFLGMTTNYGIRTMCFIPHHVILRRLCQFRLLRYNDYSTKQCTADPNPHGAGSTDGETKTSTQVYSMPPGAEKIEPSGFLRNLNNLASLGYPEPPPLMLELNGRLVNKFEEVFGYLHAWSGYSYNLNYSGDGMNAWARLDAKTITTISRRVVSLSSYHGLLIKYHGCTVILTSASLVRALDQPDRIDKNLRIEVFLPPKQHAMGTLKSCDLNHNIAIVSFKGLCAIRPEDILNIESSEWIPEHVVAIGREPNEGLLCASAGKLTDDPITALPCKLLKASTCKIKKVGIGGPLINFDNGNFIGMNFYYGNSKITPYLPRNIIVNVLKELELSESAILMQGDYPAAMDHPADTNMIERWPVPQAYWYNDLLEEDWDKGRKFIDDTRCQCEECVYWRDPRAGSHDMDLEATSAPSPSVARYMRQFDSLMNPEGTSVPSPSVSWAEAG